MHATDRLRRKVPKLLFMLWCALAVLLLWLGTLPDPYKLYVLRIPAPHPYPAWLIVVELIISAIVLAAFGWALTAKRGQRLLRHLVSTPLTIVVGVFAAASSMHMPSCFTTFALAMIVVALLSILSGLLFVMLAVTRHYGRGTD
ncbi:hypothetical protein IP91_02415 [Pseudoduganella lurida]|uniref:Transmembrane protein n=1 Tax=Pseudoduganella lurida TaxID=1036180 RepID=A0A562RDW9_9BURK|nr:hypothetical protein [Pseudoduganella lurida]TWI66596.1 hypothetical protein IP91_02415 [Pseudoduganella lurida]